MQPIKKHILFRPMVPNNDDILFSGSLRMNDQDSSVPINYDYQAQHLGCFTGGMLGIGAKIFNDESEMKIARQLTDGCIWAYKANANGIMPEIFHTPHCSDKTKCKWDEAAWEKAVKGRGSSVEAMPKGISQIDDKRYILRSGILLAFSVLHHSNLWTGPKPSNRSSSCTASRATLRCWRRHGTCGRRLSRTP